ncbi:MAG TPA: hypothetical protein VNZ86_06695 [Bacteroidia bacterium]|nr:hypothetical protein [Bacteroidia bacterium]
MPARKTNCTPEERAVLDKRLEVSKQWQRDNPEKVIESRKKHRSSILVQLKEKEYSEYYHSVNRDRERANTREYHRTHTEQDKEYIKNNKEAFRSYQNKWRLDKYNNDPSFRLRCLLSNRLRRFLKTLNGSRDSHMVDVVGCSWGELRIHIENQFTEGMSWSAMGRIHIDHIRPCVSFDLSDPEQQKLCFNYRNLRPMWNVDNQKKGAKYGGV